MFVGGLAATVNSDSLKAFLSQFGTVMDATVMYDRETDRSKGFAFATFADEDAVGRAMQGSGMELEGKQASRAAFRMILPHKTDILGRSRSRKPSLEVLAIYLRVSAAIIGSINSKVTWGEGSMVQSEVEQWAAMLVDLIPWQWP